MWSHSNLPPRAQRRHFQPVALEHPYAECQPGPARHGAVTRAHAAGSTTTKDRYFCTGRLRMRSASAAAITVALAASIRPRKRALCKVGLANLSRTITASLNSVRQQQLAATGAQPALLYRALKAANIGTAVNYSLSAPLHRPAQFCSLQCVHKLRLSIAVTTA